MGWEVYPDGLRASLARVHRDYGPPRLYVTENGAAFPDPAPRDGRIADPRRVVYLREHLLAVRRAIVEDRVPVAGYFVWSLLDNFEWGFGYTKPFGLYGVDFQSQRRILKDSAMWYRDAAAANAVVAIADPSSQGESHAVDR